jgi:hypothetical protein
MDWITIEERLARAFEGVGARAGAARYSECGELDEPFELAQILLPAGPAASRPDAVCRHGDVLERLDEQHVEHCTLLTVAWDGFGPVSHEAGLGLVGSGRRRYLCWWEEGESYRAVAAIAPWWDQRVVSHAVIRFLGCAGSEFGIQAFGRLPDETLNWRRDLVHPGALRKAYWDAMTYLEAETGDAWLSLAEGHYGRIVEPNHLQRCLDSVELLIEESKLTLEELEQMDAMRRRESADLPISARVTLLDEWLAATCRPVFETGGGDR